MDFKVVALATFLLLGSAYTIPDADIAQFSETCKNGDLYPNPSNCGAFYSCAHGVLVEMSCPAGLHFNTVANWCDYPALANCLVTTTPTLASTTEVPATELYSTLAPTTDEPEVITELPTSRPTTITSITEVSTFGPEITTKIVFTDSVEHVTTANTIQPPWTTTENDSENPEISTSPTTLRPIFRDNCHIEYTTETSSHQTYFDINLLVDNNLSNVSEFKVLVRGDQDAKIVLAHQNDRSEITSEYEIVLGEDKNKRFSINRNGKYVSREKRDTLLNSIAWLPIIVRVHNDGLIELQIEGERNAFLSAKNKNHKRIDFVGFNNDGNRSSDWLLGCPIERQAERFCTQYYFTEINETNFTTFFEIQNIEHNRPSSDIKLTVYVEATRDVGILLSSVDSHSVESSVPSYEIRLAAGTKQKDFELHRNHERLDNESENNVLHPNVRVPIDIIIETNGSIEVLVAGSKGIKLKEKDSYPVNVRFISFRSNVASLTSRWYFDC